jgi:hypothetical protein
LPRSRERANKKFPTALLSVGNFSVIFRLDLEIRLCVRANGAKLRRLSADDDIAEMIEVRLNRLNAEN